MKIKNGERFFWLVFHEAELKARLGQYNVWDIPYAILRVIIHGVLNRNPDLAQWMGSSNAPIDAFWRRWRVMGEVGKEAVK